MDYAIRAHMQKRVFDALAARYCWSLHTEPVQRAIDVAWRYTLDLEAAVEAQKARIVELESQLQKYRLPVTQGELTALVEQPGSPTPLFAVNGSNRVGYIHSQTPCTIWSRFNNKLECFEFNHIETGHVPEDVPFARSEHQKASWKNAKWQKVFGAVIANEVYENTNPPHIAHRAVNETCAKIRPFAVD